MEDEPVADGPGAENVAGVLHPRPRIRLAVSGSTRSLHRVRRTNPELTQSPRRGDRSGIGQREARRHTTARPCRVINCCTDRTNLCERCAADLFACLRGVAMCRADTWTRMI